MTPDFSLEQERIIQQNAREIARLLEINNGLRLDLENTEGALAFANSVADKYQKQLANYQQNAREIVRLRSLAAELLPFAQHDIMACDIERNFPDAQCTCGVDDLLALALALGVTTEGTK